MANYILSCCSTADLTPEHFAARDIRYTCFHYSLDGVQCCFSRKMKKFCI